MPLGYDEVFQSSAYSWISRPSGIKKISSGSWNGEEVWCREWLMMHVGWSPSEALPQSGPLGPCEGGRYQVTNKVKSSLRDAVEYQAPASNGDQE